MAHVLHSKFYILPSYQGQAALSLVLLIGGILVLTGVTLAFIVVGFVNSSYGFQAANHALAVASAGADDALIQLVRNKDFSSASYAVPTGSVSATVSVTQNSPVVGQATITSTATVGGRKRKIRAVVAVNPSTGQVHLVSWEQVN